MTELIDTGTFDEMLTLASERALAEGGVVVVHRQGCSITCPSCNTSFTVPLPISEVINTLVVSMVMATHPTPARCVGCNGRFLLGLTGYNLKWAAQMIEESEAAKVDESRIVTP